MANTRPPLPDERIMWQYGKLWGPFLPPNRETPILEIGCGCGHLLRYLRRSGFPDIEGVDASVEQVREAHRLRLPNIQRGDAVDYLKRSTKRFGVIVAENVLEHLTRGELLNLLDAVHDALREDGELWITVPNAFSPLGASVRYGDLTHEICFTPQSVHQALTACGFTDIRIREMRPLAHGVRSLVRAALWQCIRSVLYVWRLVEFGTCRPAAVFTRDMQVFGRKAPPRPERQ
jgi:2-polyprenyl-3-methyl-5-hydroxy-6-metoxy-1,4-benzoquinol methylase